MQNSKRKDYRMPWALRDWTKSWRKAGMKRVQGGLRAYYRDALRKGGDVERRLVMAM